MRVMRSRLREGWITPPEKFNVADIYWKDGLDYASFEGHAESFKWWLACLGFLRLLCTSDKLSESDEAAAQFIVSNWSNQNPRNSPSLARSWDAHAVALRTETFLELSHRSNGNWLDPILGAQMEFLAHPDNYQGNWNHGVDQARSLALVASRLRHDEFRKIGLSRLRTALKTLVDDEGVTIEQSVHYQLYNYRQIEACLRVLKEQGIDDDELAEVAERQRLMPKFLAHATNPQGTYFEIGDTPWQQAAPIAGTVAEFAATQGRAGQPPDECVKFYNAGYIFGRSGWGIARPFNEESAYAIRYGAPRIVHGHNDHMSIIYFAAGREILRDGGFHGYTDDGDRWFLRLAEAHNCVVPVGTNLRFISRPTKLVEHEIQPLWQIFSLSGEPYDGVTITRSIFVSFSANVLIISDRICCDKPLTFEQRWSLGSGLTLEQRSDASVENVEGYFDFKQHLPCEKTYITNPDDDGMKLAGRQMYELKRYASIHSQSQGNDIRFISSFSFGVPEERQRVLLLEEGGEAYSIFVGGKDDFLQLRINSDSRISSKLWADE